MARAPPGPSSGRADARCRLRSGLCPHPITPSESSTCGKWRNCLAEKNGKPTNLQNCSEYPAVSCSLQPATHWQSVKRLERATHCGFRTTAPKLHKPDHIVMHCSMRTICPQAPVPPGPFRMTLWYLVQISSDPETHSSKTDRCTALALSCRNTSPAQVASMVSWGFFFFHYSTAGTLAGVEWSLHFCTSLQPPFSGGPTVRKLRCPVPSSVSVLPASNLGMYHSFANGFLSQSSLKTWGPCN